MTRIFDNIQLSLLPTLRNYLKGAKSADFCVGYFKLRGWQEIDDLIQNFNGGEGNCCRLIVGMQNLQNSKIISNNSSTGNESIGQNVARKLKKKMASEFRKQLTSEVPTTQDEERLRRLIAQVKANQLIVKLNSKTNLHAKLYLIHCLGMEPPIVGILGSSNLTLSGLSSQGELNVEFTENDTCEQLQNWFNERWEDEWCIDISQELAEVVTQVVDESVNRITTKNILAVQSYPSPNDAIFTRSGKKKSVLKNEVSLHSDVGFDYTRLRNLLASEEWDEADQETARAILKVTRRQEEEDWEAEEWDEEHLGEKQWDEENLFDTAWPRQSIENFPCSDLRTIDQLWVQHSNGRFGFSVQKKIWQEVGRDDDVFFERIGWQLKGSTLIIEEPEKLIRKLTGEGVPISAKKLRKGHLPLRVHCFGNPTGVGSYEMVYEYLFSRLEICQIR